MGHDHFVNIDRTTPMLLPPDLRDWLPEDDLAHFILDALAKLDCSRARINQRHSGSAQYPPSMMLAVLVYSYATGTFSSRQIEALTYQHVSVRYLAANHHPDHDTICKFRRENGPLLHDAFAHVLRTARVLGVAQVGTVCLDGTKLHAQAAKRRTFNQDELKAAEAKLDLQIGELLSEAEKADAQAAPPGTLLPEHLRGHQRRREQIQLAQELLAAQTKARAAARETERAAWKENPIGDCPEARSAEPTKSDRINLTDPESALLKLPSGQYAQGYNAQLAVCAEGPTLIVAAEVTAATHDREQLQPMAAAIAASAPVQRIVADRGYDHPRHIAQVEKALGLEIICPPQQVPAAEPPAKKLSRREASRAVRTRMHQQASSPEGKQWLQRRRQTVEPVFGMIKSALGFDRFHLRGLSKVELEWKLVALAFNCRRLWRLDQANKTALHGQN